LPHAHRVKDIEFALPQLYLLFGSTADLVQGVGRRPAVKKKDIDALRVLIGKRTVLKDGCQFRSGPYKHADGFSDVP
jgi:hypothetical protein